MADETEQMIWQGDVWSGMFVHREYCRYTTGRSPFGSGPIQVISLMKLRNLVWSDQGALIGRDIVDLDKWVTRDMMETLELLRVDVATFGIPDLDFGVCHARTLTKDECLFKTIEMSLRLLGGMEANEQMDTHETEEDREKKKSWTKEKKEK